MSTILISSFSSGSPRGWRARCVAVLVAIGMLAGCTDSGSAPTSPSSNRVSVNSDITASAGGVTVSIPAGAVPAGTSLTMSQGPVVGFDIPPSGLEVASALTSVSISSEPTLPATVTFPAPPGLSNQERPVVVWQDSASPGGWRFVPTGWAPGNSTVVATVDHFSAGFIARIDIDALARTAAHHISDYASGRSGVAQPSCGDEAGARAAGVKVTSDSGDTVKWCFGLQGGKQVLRIANNRRTFTEIDFPSTWTVISDGPTFALSTDSLARALGTAVAPLPGQHARVIDGGSTLTLAVPSGGTGTAHVAISSEAWLVQAIFFGLDTYGQVIDLVGGEGASSSSKISARVLNALSGAGEPDEMAALRACGKGVGDLSGSIDEAQTASLVKFAFACVPKVIEVTGKHVFSRLAAGLLAIVVDLVASVLTAVNLLITGTRELYDDIVSIAGRSTPDYRIQIIRAPVGGTHSGGEPLLGLPWAPSQQGYGTVKPTVIFNGGDPSGLVTGIRWTGWGSAQATGYGQGWSTAQATDTASGHYANATVVAFDLGMCRGKAMYKGVSWYFPAEGGHFEPLNYLDMCTGQVVGPN